jgi:hypothetical protein
LSGSPQLSPLQQFARLPAQQRQTLLATLTDRDKAALAYRWDGWTARPAQLPPEGSWRFWLIMAGRGFGKTRIGAEETRKAASRIEFPNLIGATADDARDIMIEGESGILAVCPPWERPVYQPSKRQLAWPNGAKTLIFTADEPERLRGKQHMWLWCDEVAAWRYPEAWDQAMFGLRLGPNPQAVVTTTPKPTPLVRELVANPHTVVTRGSTYDNIANLADAFADEIIRKYEGTRLGRQELLGELLEDEGAAFRFSELVHVVPPFMPPDSWDRFESLDFGVSNPSAVLAYTVDYDGNIVVFDAVYRPGLPSEIAPLIKAKRERWWEAKDQHGRPVKNVCWADPSIWNSLGVTNRLGQKASTSDEFADLGIHMARANNDRRAGFVRISELLRQNPDRRFPTWHPLAGQPGSPRLFVFGTTALEPLRQQLKDAPLESSEPGPTQGVMPGETVSAKWEGSHGHAIASLRYGLLSRPSPSTEPPSEHPDPRRQAVIEMAAKDREREQNETRYLHV